MTIYRDSFNRFDFEDSYDGVSTDPIYINGSGYVICRDKEWTNYRPVGRMDYQFNYVRNGKIILYASDGKVLGTATSGDLIVYKPGEYQMYTYCVEETGGTESYWVHFTGTKIKELLEEHSLHEKTIYHIVDENHSITEYFNLLRNEILMKKFQYNLNCIAVFLQMLVYASRMKEMPEVRQDDTVSAIEPALEEIRANYPSDLTVQEYAAMCHLDKCYFISLFKEKVGQTPIAYRTQIRMEHARILLQNPGRSIREIASVCGYNDPFYFSRIFKKNVGVSPKVYQKQQLKKIKKQ